MSRFLFFFFLFFFSVSPGLAQGVSGIEIRPLVKPQLGERVSLEIVLKDDLGEFAVGESIELHFDPGNHVSQEVLANCAQEAEYDECSVNNRAVDGIFETSFLWEQAPLEIEVVAGELRQTFVFEDPEKDVVLDMETEKEEVEFSVQPSEVQAGPWPSFWGFLIGFAALALFTVYHFFFLLIRLQ